MERPKLLKTINKKKLIIFLVAAALIVAGVFIGREQYNKSLMIPDEEAVQILTELLPKADEINDIIWGQGLPIEPGQDPALNSVTAAQYRKVSSDAPYQSTQELKEAILMVYSEDFYEKSIKYAAFEGEDDALEGTAAQMYPRYADNHEGILTVDITNPGFSISTEIDASTAKVIKARGKKQTLEVKADVAGEKITLTLVIVEQSEGWRLDTPTY